jgi:hypothetical protein
VARQTPCSCVLVCSCVHPFVPAPMTKLMTRFIADHKALAPPPWAIVQSSRASHTHYRVAAPHLVLNGLALAPLQLDDDRQRLGDTVYVVEAWDGTTIARSQKIQAGVRVERCAPPSRRENDIT